MTVSPTPEELDSEAAAMERVRLSELEVERAMALLESDLGESEVSLHPSETLEQLRQAEALVREAMGIAEIATVSAVEAELMDPGTE